tara:strand:- start:1348 stop:2424 length:1077 start_codon:yes stop_codon:yes gene_type:complete
MKNFIVSIFAIVLISVSSQIHAQVKASDSTLRLIEKNDGTKYIAIILSDDARELLIETETIGKIYIPKSEVKRITLIENQDEIKNGELLEESPFSTRYAFTNNALPIKRNDHYAMVNLFGPEAHFAVNDHLNIGVMSTWIGSPLVAVGKYTIPTSNKKVNFSIASMFGTTGYLNGFKGFGGLHWGTFTYGNRKNNISFSAGFGYIRPGTSQETPGVYIGDSTIYTSADGTDYVDYNYPNIPFQANDDLLKSPIISVAGIFQITSSASIFFDSMFAFGEVERSDIDRNYEGGNNSPFIISVTENQLVSETFAALYLMPGMRFQKNENRAFQIAVAGVSVWDSGDNITFPLPLISWFFKF